MQIPISKLKELGINLMPLKKEAKEPVLASWTHLQTEKYTGKFLDGCNVATICGETSNNLFVVDLDAESLYDDFKKYHNKTFIVKTGKGYHFYFQYEGFPPPNKQMNDNRFRHVDIKSQGGYVVAPGSYVIPTEDKKHQYTVENRDGFCYEIVCDKPVMKIEIPEIKEFLAELGFNVENKSFTEISKGVTEGGRNNSTFKYACYLLREHGLFGEALKKEIYELNQRHTPPMPDYEIELILESVLKNEGHNIEKHMKEVQKIQKGDKDENKVEPVKMQDIRPELHEGILIEFNCTFLGVGERMTYTKSAEYECESCNRQKRLKCDDYHIIHIPVCKHGEYTPVIETIKTGYIQQIRIQEFIEDAKNSSPIEFTAEILDKNVGEAFMSDKKIVVARFRSIPQSKGYNEIIFEIVKMKNIEQTEACMPTIQEVEKWKTGSNMFIKVRDSISPELYINPTIKESLMLSAIGGISLNGKRSNTHCALLGDAQTAKSDLIKTMRKLVLGSGFAVGGNDTTAAGLTLSMVKLYNGTSIPQAGLLAIHTGKPVYYDEADKSPKNVLDALLTCMEDEIVTMAKSGTGKPGMELPASCPITLAGNPMHGGKFNFNLPNMMDNFIFSTPFISRFDIIWIITDKNDPDIDDKIMDVIIDYEKNKENYMKIEELQRYFVYARSLNSTVPKSLIPKIRTLYKKMRRLNGPDTIPIGPRQFHGIHRLLTSCASAHLRTEVNLADFVIVENMIKESYKTLKMDLESGEVTGKIGKKRETKDTIFLETWSECLDEDGTVGREEFIDKLSKKPPFNHINAPDEFKRWHDSGRVELLNDSERFKIVNT